MAIDFETVRQIATRLPEVKESLTSWGWAFKVRGKLLACQAAHRSAERDSLVVRIGFAERARLLASGPDKFYVTEHYVRYPSVLVRIPKMSRAEMQSVLQVAWSFATAGSTRNPRPARAKRVSRKKRS